MYAFDSEDKARNYLEGLGGRNRNWHVRLVVSPGGARHSGLNLYCNGTYCGMLALDYLGPALYKNPKPTWPEGGEIPVSWEGLVSAIDLTYNTSFPWGPWICHDYTAFILRSLGVQTRVNSPTANGVLYWGGRALGVVLWPGTLAMAGVHKVWNLTQDGVRALDKALGKLSLPPPSTWYWGL